MSNTDLNALIEDMSLNELQDLRSLVDARADQLRALEEAPRMAEDLVREYHQALGRGEGDQWTEPVRPAAAYMTGEQVTYEGALWESTHDFNVHPPGVSGWRQLPTEDEDGNTVVPDWVQPSGGHDAYTTGDRVTFEGKVYESVIAANTWSPSEHPAGWQLVEGEL